MSVLSKALLLFQFIHQDGVDLHPRLDRRPDGRHDGGGVEASLSQLPDGGETAPRSDGQEEGGTGALLLLGAGVHDTVVPDW